MKDLSIICVNWNSVDYLRACLRSIYASTLSLSFEVIVVDNASSDRDVHLLKAEFPEITLIQSSSNLGFVGANNLGYEYSSGSSLLFLNPDTEVVGPALTRMWNELQSVPDAAIVGCKLLNTDLSIQTSCIQRFPTITNQVFDIEWLQLRWPNWKLWGISPLFSTSASPVEVEVVSGAGLMIKRDVFEQVGLFTAAYFMYAEDVDLCFKARRMGRKSYYVPSASIIHHGGGSSWRRTGNCWAAVMQRESILIFCRRTRGHLYACLYRLAVAISSAVRLTVAGLVYPIEKVAGFSGGISSSLQKWWAVLCWAIGAKVERPSAARKQFAEVR